MHVCRLNEVFRHIPESVGFDIEVKMTTPDTEACTPPEEVDRVVTAILAEVREWEALSYRRIVFSTFDPDVALALKQRQSSIPVSNFPHPLITLTSASFSLRDKLASLPARVDWQQAKDDILPCLAQQDTRRDHSSH